MSGSFKGPGKERGADPSAPKTPVSGTSGVHRPGLFDLDLPSAASSSDSHAFNLEQLAHARITLEKPANDRESLAGELDPDMDRASELIDDQFASLARTSEFEAQPTTARTAADVAATGANNRALTHVAPEARFDATLKLPKISDTLEGRRSRLTGRFKSTVAAYKILSGLGLGRTDSQELVDLFNAYENRLRAAAPAEERKRDVEVLHGLLPLVAVEELERLAAKLEDRLLAFDDSMTEAEFRSRVSRTKQPPKALLRYARLLAARRFNIGYRRDRFEYLALELLAHEAADKRLHLLSRDKALNVLQHLLAGLPQLSQAEERAPAAAHLLEALDRLATINSPKEFFDSEFFLDLYGYKVSMRDQVSCPEFLYLSGALHVEIHNRMLAWSKSGTPSLEALRSQLQAQKVAAEDVFTNYRRPRATPSPGRSPAPPSAPRPAQAGQTAPARVRKKRRKPAKEAARSERAPWLKLAVLMVVAVVSTGSALHSSGIISGAEAPVVLSHAQLQRLSPALISGTLKDHGQRLEALVYRPKWLRLTPLERRALADALVVTLKAKGIKNARVLAYKTPVIEIEFATLVRVDDGKP